MTFVTLSALLSSKTIILDCEHPNSVSRLLWAHSFLPQNDAEVYSASSAVDRDTVVLARNDAQLIGDVTRILYQIHFSM